MIYDHEINTEQLQKAIVVWQAMIEQFKKEKDDFKANHKLTWWLRREFWKLDDRYFKAHGALIKRRIQLQTAIKAKGN